MATGTIDRTTRIPEDAAVPMGVDAAEIRRAVGVRTPEAGRTLFVGRLAAG